MSHVYNPVSGKDDDVPNGTSQDKDKCIAEGLHGRPTSVPTVAGQSLIQITAPSSLPEGYELPVQLGSHQFNVKVPLGGIEQGQVFSVPVPTETIASQSTRTVVSSIPVGAWRDDECDCCNYGACHPHIWTSLLCPLLAAGQVINRLQLTWYGAPAQTTAESARAYVIMLSITIFNWALYFMLPLLFLIIGVVSTSTYDYNDDATHKEYDSPFYDSTSQYDPKTSTPIRIIAVVSEVYHLWKLIYWFIIFGVLLSLRITVRNKFGIRGTFVKDCCCSFWCHWFVAGQMLRHTTDYDFYTSRVCSDTGLSRQQHTAPMIV